VNIELLEKIKQRILRAPQKFRMDEWDCGTAMCIAGLACAMDRHRPKAMWKQDYYFSPQLHAARLLGFGKPDWADRTPRGNRLFFVDYWPDSFRDRFRAARLRKTKARIAAERIDHFIATNGQE
jgi:hypothetical protein